MITKVLKLFPSAKGLEPTWHSIVKIGQSLYREAPGMDPYRPDQSTPVPNFFLAGSYTKQDYIDSMYATHVLPVAQATVLLQSLCMRQSQHDGMLVNDCCGYAWHIVAGVLHSNLAC